MVDMAHIAGLIAAGLHPNPVPHADIVTTTTHKTLRGPRGGMILCKEAYAKAVNSNAFSRHSGRPARTHHCRQSRLPERKRYSPRFKVYQQQIINNAAVMATAPAEGGFRIVSGGTDNHLMLVDLRPKKLTPAKSPRKPLDKAGITVSKNAVPFDPEKPAVASGGRVGTPAVTTRGMKEAEMEQIAGLITEVLDKPEDAALAAAVQSKVRALTAKFPLPY
ncbi:MAG: hypothetical protein MZV49_05435 [Rhodopseudomonas palustris]|nr:hypothetical protein [Rhodopseudomonas palustris]